jgi:hypothetical protein
MYSAKEKTASKRKTLIVQCNLGKLIDVVWKSYVF